MRRNRSVCCACAGGSAEYRDELAPLELADFHAAAPISAIQSITDQPTSVGAGCGFPIRPMSAWGRCCRKRIFGTGAKKSISKTTQHENIDSSIFDFGFYYCTFLPVGRS